MKLDADYQNDIKKSLHSIPHIEKLFGKKLFLTGATGMIGSSIVEIVCFLNRFHGAGIHLILGGRSKERIDGRFREWDDFSYEYLPYDSTCLMDIACEADYIIQAAGECSPDFYRNHPVETIKNSIIGVQTLLDLARKNVGSRLLYISSSEVYGNRFASSNEPYKVDEIGFVDTLNPRASYPNGKRTAESLCSCYMDEYGVDVVIVRPGHIYGPRYLPSNARVSTLFTENAVDGRDIVLKSAGSQIRSYCYALDCASAILTAMLEGKTGEAYNISNKDSIITIRDLAEEFARCGGVNVVFETPSDAERKAYNLMDNSSLNSAKLEALGWKGAFDVKSGVKRTYEIVSKIKAEEAGQR